MATVFRLVTLEDADHLFTAIRSWHAREGLSLNEGDARRELGRMISDSTLGHAWLVERGGEPVGYAILSFREALRQAPRAYVAGLYVAPGHRGKGIGRQIQRHLEEVGRWLKVRVLGFDVHSESKHAQLLYRKPGNTGEWQPIDTRAIA